MNKLIAIGIVSVGLATLAACDVRKTQEGNVTLPKYDVKAPDVKVTTEEKVIEVPKIEVTPAK